MVLEGSTRRPGVLGVMGGRRLPLAAAFGFVAACSSPADPFTDGPAHASVGGWGVNAGGFPGPGTTIRIACGGGADPLSVATDSAGRYLASLETDSDPFSGRGGVTPRRFNRPAPGRAAGRGANP